MSNNEEGLRDLTAKPIGPVVARFRELLEKVTPGPWAAEAWLEVIRLMFERDAKEDVRLMAILYEWPHPQPQADAAFIAAARNELPALLDSHDALLEALEQVEALIGVTFGEGPEANIPETIPTRLGVPVKLGDIMRNVRAAIAKATGAAVAESGPPSNGGTPPLPGR